MITVVKVELKTFVEAMSIEREHALQEAADCNQAAIRQLQAEKQAAHGKLAEQDTQLQLLQDEVEATKTELQAFSSAVEVEYEDAMERTMVAHRDALEHFQVEAGRDAAALRDEVTAALTECECAVRQIAARCHKASAPISPQQLVHRAAATVVAGHSNVLSYLKTLKLRYRDVAISGDGHADESTGSTVSWREATLTAMGQPSLVEAGVVDAGTGFSDVKLHDAIRDLDTAMRELKAEERVVEDTLDAQCQISSDAEGEVLELLGCIAVSKMDGASHAEGMQMEHEAIVREYSTALATLRAEKERGERSVQAHAQEKLQAVLQLETLQLDTEEQLAACNTAHQKELRTYTEELDACRAVLTTELNTELAACKVLTESCDGSAAMLSCEACRASLVM